MVLWGVRVMRTQHLHKWTKFLHKTTFQDVLNRRIYIQLLSKQLAQTWISEEEISTGITLPNFYPCLWNWRPTDNTHGHFWSNRNPEKQVFKLHIDEKMVDMFHLNRLHIQHEQKLGIIFDAAAWLHEPNMVYYTPHPSFTIHNSPSDNIMLPCFTTLSTE